MSGAQAQAFLAMMLAGAVLGAGYDVLALVRRGLSLRAVGTAIADLLFGILCAAGITLCALALRTDPFRWYAFAGVAAGMAIYFASIGTFVRILCRSFKKRVKEFKIPAGKNQI